MPEQASAMPSRRILCDLPLKFSLFTTNLFLTFYYAVKTGKRDTDH